MSYAGKIEELIAERDALRQRVNDEQEKNIQIKLAVLKAKAKLTAERAISDKLERELLDAINMIECMHKKFQETGSGNGKIAQWQQLLAELAAMRKLETA